MDKESRSRFDEVYREIKEYCNSTDKGCMYTAISKLSPDNYQKICEHFNITQDSTIKQDLQFFKKYFIDDDDNDWSNNMDRVLEVLCKEVLDKPLPEEDPLTQCLRVTPELWLKVYFILFISLIVIGSYAFLKPVIFKTQEKPEPNTPPPSPPLKDSTQQYSILCLVVPSDQLSGLNQDYLIPSNRVKELILSASYFLCDASVEAIDQKVNLKLSPDSINYSSKEDAYIQLIIPGGENIIGKTTKFELRKNLPDGDAKIDKIGRLIKIYGLENFICA
ncbi:MULTISPECIES: hypothetical protein [unclassified Moorena]|uniref:hypothetical protein n=1 Tax=unclassified Moorena TaxID=2683338 RepID=UPI0013BACBAB|nr:MULTISPECIES: hypothetical protein [unclassified Moorena]NEP35778.1 hypothetical protein [Moorena sp. SIO3B2]NEQ10487.1 hypothetical protein [Moorena sp. SIO4E2]